VANIARRRAETRREALLAAPVARGRDRARLAGVNQDDSALAPAAGNLVVRGGRGGRRAARGDRGAGNANQAEPLSRRVRGGARGGRGRGGDIVGEAEAPARRATGGTEVTRRRARVVSEPEEESDAGNFCNINL